MALPIDDNRVVTIHYTVTDNDGTVIDSSEDHDPLVYLHGSGGLISGLERELAGKSSGVSMQVKIQPADAYGEIHSQLIETVPRAAFQDVDTIEPGMAFEARRPDGQPHRIVVKEVNGDEVTIDANHPLAGVELNFHVLIVDVREASEEEIAHGHVH